MINYQELWAKSEQLKNEYAILKEAAEDLVAEKKLLPGELARVVRTTNGDQVRVIQDRMEGIDADIFDAQIAHLMKVVEYCEVSEAARLAEIEAVRAEIAPVVEQIKELEEQLAPAKRRLIACGNNERRWRDQRVQAILKIDGLTQQRQIDLNAAGAPVVRALNYARG